jgi:uncharacterized protein YlxW (UPF0749 family)
VQVKDAATAEFEAEKSRIEKAANTLQTEVSDLHEHVKALQKESNGVNLLSAACCSRS